MYVDVHCMYMYEGENNVSLFGVVRNCFLCGEVEAKVARQKTLVCISDELHVRSLIVTYSTCIHVMLIRLVSSLSCYWYENRIQYITLIVEFSMCYLRRLYHN